MKRRIDELKRNLRDKKDPSSHLATELVVFGLRGRQEQARHSAGLDFVAGESI